MTLSILRVALATPVRKLFDYLPPQGCSFPFEIGARILVPFRNQKKVGIIIEIRHETDLPLEKLKTADAILDTKALLPKELFLLIQWASRYYQSSLGEVFETALPSRLRKETPTKSRTKKEVKEKLALENNSLKPLHPALDLNAAQQQALDSINLSLGTFKTFLLDGVTGSGKTEVYIRVIERVLQAEKQALILVPEIGLTPQLLTRLQERFSVPIASLNSSLTEKRRYEAWEAARTGAAPIVIGTRSAAFVPLKSPGVFIIDEEHDASFKQQEGFRYHARDLIILRASLEQCPVILGTATPSLETLHNIHLGRFQNLKLPTRAGKGTIPNLQILDVRHKKLEEGLSTQLIAKMREHIEDKGQILLFLNRRGFAPVLMCLDCNWVASCKNCDAKMTLHYQAQKLQCHHCETTIPMIHQCPSCQSKNLKPVGIGTERLETALQNHFPNQSISRIDRDTTRKKGTLQTKIDSIHSGETEILIGTQMIAKGHHFPNVTLVAILDIDHALFSTDFRSTERMGQLITQVAGRTGRGSRLGQVILQTCHPEHPLLKKLLEEGYHPFANSLLNERRMINLPPYSHQALIRAESNKPNRALNFLNHIKRETLHQQNAVLKILGPSSAPMERRLGFHRAQLIFQSDQRSTLQKLLKDLLLNFETHPSANGVRWSIDVDPIDMY